MAIAAFPVQVRCPSQFSCCLNLSVSQLPNTFFSCVVMKQHSLFRVTKTRPKNKTFLTLMFFFRCWLCVMIVMPWAFWWSFPRRARFFAMPRGSCMICFPFVFLDRWLVNYFLSFSFHLPPLFPTPSLIKRKSKIKKTSHTWYCLVFCFFFWAHVFYFDFLLGNALKVSPEKTAV